MVPPPSRKVPRVSRYSGFCWGSSDFGYGAFTLSGRLSQNLSPVRPAPFSQSLPRDARIPVWAPPVSLAATPGIDVSFSSSGYLDVSVRRVPLRALCVRARMHEVLSCGFPHSDISGSQDICSSPELFAACHVFHRLPVPRHPPWALFRMTSFLAVSSFLRKKERRLPLPCSA